MTKSQDWLNQLRISYEVGELSKSDLHHDPMAQFGVWLEEAVSKKLPEPNAFSLATVGENQTPSSRTVLLKSFDEKGFVFFTNYQSKKAKQLSLNPNVAMNFVWLPLHRQVIVEGEVSKISRAESEAYFKTRPLASQLGAWTSPQSQELENREALDQLAKEFSEKFSSEVPTPDFWGGYLITPKLIEFWQGRPSRLHDRLRFTKNENNWQVKRIAP